MPATVAATPGLLDADSHPHNPESLAGGALAAAAAEFAATGATVLRGLLDGEAVAAMRLAGFGLGSL